LRQPSRSTRRRTPPLTLALSLLLALIVPQAALAQSATGLDIFPDLVPVGYEVPFAMSAETQSGENFVGEPVVRILADGVEVPGAVDNVEILEFYPPLLTFDLTASLPAGTYQVAIDDGTAYLGTFEVGTEPIFASIDPDSVPIDALPATTFSASAFGADWGATTPTVSVRDRNGASVATADVIVLGPEELTFRVPGPTIPGNHEVRIVGAETVAQGFFTVDPGPSVCEATAPLPAPQSGLTNVGFEDGLAGWTLGTVSDGVTVVGTDSFGGGDATTTVAPFEGGSMVRLGRAYDDAVGRQPRGPNELCQDFTVTSSRERFVFNVFTYDYTGFDEFRYDVTLQDESGQVIARYEQGAFGEGTELKTTGWRGVELDLTGRVGETVRLTISGGGTSDDLYGFWAYVDSAVNVEFPDPVPVTPIVGGNGSAMFDPTSGQTTIAFPVGTTDFGDLSLTYPVGCSGDDAVDAVTVLLDDTPFPATLNAEGTSAAVVIPAAAVGAAAANGATITVQIDCPEGRQIITIGRIVLYDPSGILTDAETGEFVVGAEVRLWRVPGWSPRTGPEDDRPDTCESNLSKAPEDPWSQPAPTFLGVPEPAASASISPNVNPFISNSVGYYGWDVAEGCWYVTVTADGYAPLTSPVVGVPPEVVDLDLELTPVEISAPTWPDGATLTAVPSATSVQLSWPAATGVADPISYQVRRGGTLVSTTGGTSATVSGLSELTGYTFSVTPIDANGTPGEALTASATTLDGTPPAWPSGAALTAVPAVTSVTLSWPAATDPSTPVTYTVRRGGTVVATTELTTLTVTDLAELTSYSFSVTASDAVGNAGTALTTSATTLDATPPSWPSGAALAVGVTSSQVSLSWPAASDPSTPITYLVQRVGAAVVETTARNRTFTGLSPETTYTFEVRARDAAGNVGTALSIQVTTGPPPPVIEVRPPTCDEATTVPPFRDVPASYTHAEAIACSAGLGLVLGRDGAFVPNGTLTRAQLASILLRALEASNVTLTTRASGFTDIRGSTHEDAIRKLAAAGVIQGKSATTFDPNGPVTRGQLVTLLDRASARFMAAYPDVSGPRFQDTRGSTHAAAIDRLNAAGIANGYGGGRFGPNDSVQRGQAASFVTRWLEDQAERLGS
jgi:chitodextrinase